MRFKVKQNWVNRATDFDCFTAPSIKKAVDMIEAALQGEKIEGLSLDQSDKPTGMSSPYLEVYCAEAKCLVATRSSVGWAVNDQVPLEFTVELPIVGALQQALSLVPQEGGWECKLTWLVDSWLINSPEEEFKFTAANNGAIAPQCYRDNSQLCQWLQPILYQILGTI